MKDYKKDFLVYLFKNQKITIPFCDMKPLLRTWKNPKEDWFKLFTVLLRDDYVECPLNDNWKKYSRKFEGRDEFSFDECNFTFRLKPYGEKYVRDNYMKKWYVGWRFWIGAVALPILIFLLSLPIVRQYIRKLIQTMLSH